MKFKTWDKGSKEKNDHVLNTFKKLIPFRKPPKSISISFNADLLLKECENLTEGKLSQGEIIKIINDIDSSTIIDIPTLDRITQRNLKSKSKTKCEVFFPIQLPTSKRLIYLDGKQVQYSRIKPIYRSNNHNQTRKEVFEKGLYIIVDAINHREAIIQALSHFELIFGIYEFILSIDNYQIVHPTNKARSKIVISNKIYSYDFASKKVESLEIYTSSRINPSFKYSDVRNLKFENYILDTLNKKGNFPVCNLLEDAFRLYWNAQDIDSSSNTFLHFWQLSERLTLSQRNNGNTQEVIKRLEYFERKLIGLNLTESLKIQSKKRNDLVHKGINTIEEEDISLLKMINESIIRWLLKYYKLLKTEDHFEEFYKLEIMPPNKSMVLKDFIRLVDKLK